MVYSTTEFKNKFKQDETDNYVAEAEKIIDNRMKYYRAPDVVFANVNGTDIAIGNGLDFDSCEDFIFRQIAAIDSLDKAAEEMGFPDGQELIEDIAVNGEDEDFYKQIVMDRYHGGDCR